MTRLLLASVVMLMACGARTELDPLGSDAGPTPDAPAADIGPVGPGLTVALFSGDTAADGTSWGRPFSCGDTGGDGYPYSVVTFDNPTRADLRVEVLVDWEGFDGFLHVYESPFDPARVNVGCLGSNDDFEGTARSRVQDITVRAGQSIDLVLSSWAAGSSGRYDAFVVTQ
ncbi:MAG: hypothetical protein AB8H86_13490 [Polyangiales bacterium]